jgi:hypothetical protein
VRQSTILLHSHLKKGLVRGGLARVREQVGTRYGNAIHQAHQDRQDQFAFGRLERAIDENLSTLRQHTQTKCTREHHHDGGVIGAHPGEDRMLLANVVKHVSYFIK